MSVPVVAPTRPAPTAGVAVAPRRTRRPRDLVATILLYAVLVAGLLVMLGTVMVPGMVTFVPLFVLVSNLHLVNTYAGLVLPFLAGAFGVFFMRQFILSIPDDLLESARVDGAGELRIFLQIVLPLCGPALATL